MLGIEHYWRTTYPEPFHNPPANEDMRKVYTATSSTCPKSDKRLSFRNIHNRIRLPPKGQIPIGAWPRPGHTNFPTPKHGHHPEASPHKKTPQTNWFPKTFEAILLVSPVKWTNDHGFRPEASGVRPSCTKQQVHSAEVAPFRRHV